MQAMCACAPINTVARTTLQYSLAIYITHPGVFLSVARQGGGGATANTAAAQVLLTPAQPGLLIEAPWLVNGGHGASFRLPFGS
jgi:hypothetical protein